MHQRIGKTHSAGPMDGPDRIDTRTLTNFFQECFDELDETGDDAAVYFEQLVDYFRNHYRPSKGLESAGKVLGL